MVFDPLAFDKYAQFRLPTWSKKASWVGAVLWVICCIASIIANAHHTDVDNGIKWLWSSVVGLCIDMVLFDPFFIFIEALVVATHPDVFSADIHLSDAKADIYKEDESPLSVSLDLRSEVGGMDISKGQSLAVNKKKPRRRPPSLQLTRAEKIPNATESAGITLSRPQSASLAGSGSLWEKINSAKDALKHVKEPHSAGILGLRSGGDGRGGVSHDTPIVPHSAREIRRRYDV